MKNRNHVNLNVNPCKMCMPLGAVVAFKGIEKSMVILHGSQGCSTYIRRHMAGHYNEPIDIASSSLNEHGTVYGGEKNLKKGLRNIISLYNPEVIGVATTCLAETIGEDIARIVTEFKKENEHSKNVANIAIVPVATPGYGGSQFEGYYSALTSIVKELSKDCTPNNKINIIAPNVNPGDIRNIKRILDMYSMDYTILPDVSETLDAPFKDEFNKIPEGGTKLKDIVKMAGAAATIEIGVTIPDNISPGKYLNETYKVPLYRCPIPMGLKNTNELIKLLSKLSQKTCPKILEDEKGRFIDGMIDSHKHNGEGRAVIFGEPELCYGVTKLCIENGIKPVLISTGTGSELLRELLDKENFINEEKVVIIDDTDFDTIEDYAVRLKGNILIGNSDGKVITERQGIPLVRIGFPIHDRVGGQRNNTVGYDGSLKLLDDITNSLLDRKYSVYRDKMYENYFLDGDRGKKIGGDHMRRKKEVKKEVTIEDKTLSHPCFTIGACRFARMHIPVAPACNIQCNYCNRKFDCVNESRPGVTSEVLTPQEARDKFIQVKNKVPNLSVIGIAGPGDALANFNNTRESIKLIKEVDPDITFCLSTNGLMLPYYAEELVGLGVTHVTVTINAVDPEVGAKIYKEVNFRGKKLTGVRGAEILLKNQLMGLQYLCNKGIVCKVNIVMIKGVNQDHIEEVVKKVKECGVYMTNIMPLIPAKGSDFENMPLTNNKELGEMRKKCETYTKQMYHCKQCRADAIGLLGDDVSSEFRMKEVGGSKNQNVLVPSGKEYTFAVATKSGTMVDAHFGHVEEFYIYSYKDNNVEFLERRKIPKYCTGNEECDEDNKIDRIIGTLKGCHGVIVLRIGHHPLKKLQEMNIKVIQSCGSINDGILHAIEEIKKDNEDSLKTVV